MPTHKSLAQPVINETQQKILDAAIECVSQWGINKTNLNDIAKQAGVTRPTVYSYFRNRNDVLRSALLQSGYAFGKRVFDHIGGFDNTVDRYVETVLFVVEELPKEPYLTVITQAAASSLVNQGALNDEQGQRICWVLFEEIFKGTAISEGELTEITEITTRFVLSLLTVNSPRKRTSQELRDLLVRRFVPMMGL